MQENMWARLRESHNESHNLAHIFSYMHYLYFQIYRSEEKRKETEMVRNSAEKEEERLLGELKLGEHLRREEEKDREHVSCARAFLMYRL